MIAVGLAGHGSKTRSFVPTISAAVGASTVDQSNSVLVSTTAEVECKDGTCRVKVKAGGTKAVVRKIARRCTVRGLFRRLRRR